MVEGNLEQHGHPAVFCAALRSKLLHFNGKLFKTCMLALDRDEIHRHGAPAALTGRKSEPAIFGALLERASTRTSASLAPTPPRLTLNGWCRPL